MLTRLRQSKAYARISEYEIVHQFVKYATVGVLNTTLFFGLFNALDFLIPTVGAYAAAFLITSVGSFILNKFWSFRDQSRHRVVRQYLVFVIFTLFGLGLNTGAFRLLLIPLEQYGRLGKNAAALATLPLSVIWNFTAYRRWTFKPTPRSSTVGSGAHAPGP